MKIPIIIEEVSRGQDLDLYYGPEIKRVPSFELMMLKAREE